MQFLGFFSFSHEHQILCLHFFPYPSAHRMHNELPAEKLAPRITLFLLIKTGFEACWSENFMAKFNTTSALNLRLVHFAASYMCYAFVFPSRGFLFYVSSAIIKHNHRNFPFFRLKRVSHKITHVVIFFTLQLRHDFCMLDKYLPFICSDSRGERYSLCLFLPAPPTRLN